MATASRPDADYAAFGRESARMLMNRVSEKDTSVAWSHVKEYDGINISRGVVDDNDWNVIKAVGIVRCPARILADRLTDPKEMKTFDENTDVCNVLVDVDDRTKVLHVKAKAVFPTTARDFVVVTAKEESIESKNLTIVIASRSVKHDAAPLDPSYVRATTYLSGYVIRSTSTSACEVTMLVHMNLGGSLPSFVINMLAVDAPLHLIGKLRELYADPDSD
ncbi:hypothetical protein H310_07688 [Aphanomyces invadans]|uniref:START domain-containing protein n=1 Tax=Aphanomyces invadans TaxID=157072 RepID=A0A024U354_9STRA|nr:hypothetical protein H310_07688 [Aphanomyces invadans]ETW00317.1 hypothetical protein H310_07688 [Aphanomyces invadans]RHY28531.1 hypothetical protein DYB32_005900 [Aphanomyces invadans]|eukprot:XP_008871342.1 hypothetical protein H310_07688 [Aphanomyces invadans]